MTGKNLFSNISPSFKSIGIALIIVLCILAIVRLFSPKIQKETEPVEEMLIQEESEEHAFIPFPSPQADVEVKEKPFAIQVFSFRDKEKARTAQEKLEGEGYTAYVITGDLEGNPIYRVWVGEFSTKGEAESFLAQIKEVYEDAFIVSRE